MSSLCWYEDLGTQYVASTRTCTHQHACCVHVLPWQPVAAAIYWSDASHVSKCACATIGGAPHVDAAANELGRSLGVNWKIVSAVNKRGDAVTNTQTGDSYSTSKHPSHLSAIRGRTRRVIWNRIINISIIQIQLTFGSYLSNKVTTVQKGNKDNRWEDWQKDKERDEERKGETALCGGKTDSIPGYGTGGTWLQVEHIPGRLKSCSHWSCC